MRVVICALLFAIHVLAVDYARKAHVKQVDEPTKFHPGIRAFTTGATFVFAVTNSHISPNDNSYTEVITLIITNYDASKTATVTVSTPSGVFNTTTLQVAPQQNYQLNLPPEIQTDYLDAHKNAYQITNRSIFITADTTITVVARNSHSDGLSEDEFVVYPLCQLGTSYRTVGDEAPSKGISATNIFSIVAAYDNTNVTISPQVTDQGTFTLSKGQVLTLATDKFAMHNLHVTSSLPVAVISGAVCGFGYFNQNFCNYEALMLFPTGDTGVKFPYTKFASEDTGELMIFATADDTAVYLNGVKVVELDNQWYYIISLSNSVYVTTSKPTYVVTVSSMRSDGRGGPFLAHIPAVDQYTNQTYIQVTTGLALRDAAQWHYIRIQADLSVINSFTVDDFPINPLAFIRQGNSNVYYTDFQIQPGTHVIKSLNPKAYYAATVYGFSLFTAYAYTPGIDLPSNGAC